MLRAVAYGESDRIVTLLGRDHGKIAALAKGARRSQKRFAGGLGLLSLGLMSYTERPGADLARLESFDARASWPGILADLAKIAHAGYAAELLEALTPMRQADPSLFALALAFVRTLDAGVASAELLRVFELQLLDHLGLRPMLTQCVVCGRVADDAPGQRLDPHRGGIVCGSCHGAGPLVDADARHTLVLAQSASLDQAKDLTLPPASQRGAREALQALLTQHAGRTLRSVEFIEKLRQTST